MNLVPAPLSYVCIFTFLSAMEPLEPRRLELPKELARETFLRPRLNDNYEEYWEALLMKSSNDFPSAVREMFTEYETFVLSALKNHHCFYSSHVSMVSRPGVDVVLIKMYRGYKIFQLYIGHLDSTGSLCLHQVMQIARNILDSARSTTNNKLELQLSVEFGKVLSHLAERCSLQFIERIELVS